MKNRASLVAAAAVLGLAGAAFGQGPTTTAAGLTYTLSWQDSGNNNGILEQGESALLSMTVTLSPSVGTVIPYSGGQVAAGTLRGIGSGFFDVNSNNAVGTATYSNLTIDGAFDLTGQHGTQAGQNIQNAQFGQFPFSANATNPAQSVANMWTAVWTPSSYSDRTVTFNVAAGSAATPATASAVVIQWSATGVQQVSAVSTFGNISIPVVPAPSSLALLGLGGLIAGRRRR